MPTYEYACAACDTRQEIQQKMTDASLTVCPLCGDPSLRKVFSGVGVMFKGSGFYRNDSRDSGKKDGGSKDGGSKDGAKKESTPASTAPSTAGDSSGSSSGSSSTGSTSSTSTSSTPAPSAT